jgi:hypothetical protein
VHVNAVRIHLRESALTDMRRRGRNVRASASRASVCWAHEDQSGDIAASLMCRSLLISSDVDRELLMAGTLAA